MKYLRALGNLAVYLGEIAGCLLVPIGLLVAWTFVFVIWLGGVGSDEDLTTLGEVRMIASIALGVAAAVGADVLWHRVRGKPLDIRDWFDD